MDLGHSPDTGASEGELRSGYALTPSPSHSKNISLFTERRTSERAVSKDGYSSFLFNPLWGFPVVAAGILFVVDHPLDKGLAKDSIRLILAALSVLYSDAVEKEIVIKNPTIGMGKFYRQAPKKHEEIEPLTEEEVVQLLEATLKYAPDQYPLFLCALHSGMRSEELAGLQWGDIDWNGKFLKVRRNFVRGRVGTLKTNNGRRRVDLSDELIETLSGLRRTKQKEALARGRNEIPEWIFANRRGNPADMHNLKRRYFRKVLRNSGLRSIRFHDLRHTYASLLLAQGQPLTYVSQQLGHANPQITLKTYSQWIPNRTQREAVNRLPTLKSRRSRKMDDPTNHEVAFR